MVEVFNNHSRFFVGQLVSIDTDLHNRERIGGKVIALMFDDVGRVEYKVAWWANYEHKTEWFSESRLIEGSPYDG